MKTPNKVEKIIFFYDISEVDNYLMKDKNKSFASNDELFIAMTPSVYSYLKQKDIEAQNTLNYFTNESHKELLKKSKILVEWLRKEVDFVDIGVGIRDAYKDSFIFWTRLASHYCLKMIEIVLNAIDMHKPEIVRACLSGKRAVLSLYIEPEEKYLGYIVNAVAKKKNLKFEDISSQNSNKQLFFSKWIDYASSLIAFVFRYIRFRIWRKNILGRNKSTMAAPIFFTTQRGMDKVIDMLHNEDIDRSFYFLKGPAVSFGPIPDFVIGLIGRKHSQKILMQKKKIIDLEKKIYAQSELFSYRDISFAEVISNKIQDNISHYILGQYLWTARLNRFFDKQKPAAIISNGGRFDDTLLAELCQRRSIPTILISHGSHVYPKNEYEIDEWGEHGRSLLRAPFSFLALQSPLAEGYLNTFPSKSNIIKTGPLVWGKPIKIEESKKLFKKMINEKYNFGNTKIILHAGTPKQSNYPRFYVYETPDEYIQAIRDIANVVEKIDNTVLIVKFRPGKEIGINDLKRLIPFSEKVILSVGEPFIDVLGMSDLLVSFSSTTIEEALQNRIPVLLYGGNGRYQHVPAFEIKRDSPLQKSAVYHVKEATDLKYAITHILDLDIDRDRDEYIFNPYVYAEHSRASIADLLKNII